MQAARGWSRPRASSPRMSTATCPSAGSTPGQATLRWAPASWRCGGCQEVHGLGAANRGALQWHEINLLLTCAGCQCDPLLPRDGAPAAVGWAGRQDQDVGCQRQRQKHAHLPGPHQGLRMLLLAYVLSHDCSAASVCDATDGVLRYIRTLQGVRDINFSRDGRKFLSSSYDKSGIKLWDTETGQVSQHLAQHVAGSWRLLLEAQLRRYSVPHFHYCLQVISTFGAGKMFYVAKLHPNEDKQNMLFGGCGDKKVYQFDVDTGDAIQVHSMGKWCFEACCLLLHDDERTMWEHEVLWNVLIATTQEYDYHLSAVNTITFVDEGRRFVTTSDDKTIRVWELGIPVQV